MTTSLKWVPVVDQAGERRKVIYAIGYDLIIGADEVKGGIRRAAVGDSVEYDCSSSVYMGSRSLLAEDQ
jgi:hypothetical protein